MATGIGTGLKADPEAALTEAIQLAPHDAERPHRMAIMWLDPLSGNGGERRGRGRGLVVLEGWMLDFTPVPVTDPDLEVINGKLAASEAWYRLIDAMISLRADDPHSMLRWRTEAEDHARASENPALSPDEISDYVHRFLPAYETWADTVTHGRWSPDRQLALTLDHNRQPRTNLG